MNRYTQIGATISPCGLFRPRLWRHWDDARKVLVWIMLNPSWGDAEKDDNTIRKVVNFAKLWGYGGIEIVNLFGFRTHVPAVLKQHGYQGADEYNDRHIRAVVRQHRSVVCAWGGNANCPAGHKAIARVSRILDDLNCELHVNILALKISPNGMPWHPLYVSYKTAPVPFYQLLENEL